MDNKFIPLSVPNLKGNELQYVTEAIQTEWVSTGGKFITDFEVKLSEYVNSKGAVACQSGTSGIHLALEVCGVKKNDEVIVPTLTFIATVNPIKYINANPVFMDCDDTLNIDCDKLEDFLSTQCEFVDGKLLNKSTNAQIKAMIVVHIFGNIANMERIMNIAKKYNLKVIEDAAEALGSYYTEGVFKNRHAGTIGDIGVYSFNGNKIITTGGGGMIVSNDKKYLQQAKYLSMQAKDNELHYIHNEIGYNYRMTNLQAALGLAQIEQLERFIKIKMDNYFFYQQQIKGIKGLQLLLFHQDIRANHWFYSIILDSELFDRDTIIQRLLEHGVQTRPVWGLIHDQKPYRHYETYKLEKALYYQKRVINIPCSSNLTTEDIKKVIRAIKDIIGGSHCGF